MESKNLWIQTQINETQKQNSEEWMKCHEMKTKYTVPGADAIFMIQVLKMRIQPIRFKGTTTISFDTERAGRKTRRFVILNKSTPCLRQSQQNGRAREECQQSEMYFRKREKRTTRT